VKRLIKIVFMLAIVGAVAAIVASVVSKRKLSSMSDDEIRAFLDSKLSGKVGDDQLGSIQTAVIAGVRRGGAASDHVAEVAEEAVTDLEEVVKNAAADDTGESVEADESGSEDPESSVEEATA